MFVDALAMVAILADEPEAAALEEALSRAASPLTSAVALYETALAVARKLELDPAGAQAAVDRLMQRAQLRLVPIGPEELRLALDAHTRFGKGRHPARLNMGDCFAYACARAHDAPLLYKGEDFALTDIRPA